jgi:anti-anti-sigma factor
MPVPVYALPTEVGPEAQPAIARGIEETLGPGGSTMVVDLGAVLFLGSAALGDLVKLGKRLRERGGGMALARPRPRIRRLLALVGLDAVLPAFPTLEEACAHVERLRAEVEPGLER